MFLSHNSALSELSENSVLKEYYVSLIFLQRINRGSLDINILWSTFILNFPHRIFLFLV